jgi:hypothetical protein
VSKHGGRGERHEERRIVFVAVAPAAQVMAPAVTTATTVTTVTTVTEVTHG